MLTPYTGQLLLLRKCLAQASIVVELNERDKEDLANKGLQLDDDESESKEEDEKDEAKSDDEDHCSNDNTHHVSVAVVRQTLRDSVRISTVDNFQGEEALIVVLSTVRSNTRGSLGFLAIDNRVNVALSRAKHGMVVLCSADTVEQYEIKQEERHAKKRSPVQTGPTMFAQAVRHLHSKGCVSSTLQLQCQMHGAQQRVETAADFTRLAPDGGCIEPCASRLDCGHMCRRLCHPDDREHKIGVKDCAEPCTRLMDCGHACKLICKEPCDCHEFVLIKLNCGHSLRVTCAQRHDVHKCQEPVPMPGGSHPVCGHSKPNQTVPCSHAAILASAAAGEVTRESALEMPARSILFRCQEICGGRRDCSQQHDCKRRCGDCTRETVKALTVDSLKEAHTRSVHFGSCPSPCDRPLMCGHACTSNAKITCHSAKDCPPCDKPCAVRCAHSNCAKSCKDVCALCTEKCVWKCSTQHPGAPECCDLRCGTPCDRLPCDRRCELLLKECGHRCPGLCGEACPSSLYCRECALSGVDIAHGAAAGDGGTAAPASGALEKRSACMQQIVDYVMLSSLQVYALLLDSYVV